MDVVSNFIISASKSSLYVYDTEVFISQWSTIKEMLLEERRAGVEGEGRRRRGVGRCGMAL